MPVAGGASHPALLTFVVRAEPERHLHGRITASARNEWLASEPLGLLANREATYPGWAHLFLWLKGNQLSSRKCPMSHLCWSECKWTHLSAPLPMWSSSPLPGAPQRLVPSGVASGTTALSGMYPTRQDPTGHRQAGVTWLTLSGQNHVPTQPVQDLKRDGVSVQRAGIVDGQLSVHPIEQQGSRTLLPREPHALGFTGPAPAPWTKQPVIQPAAGSAGPPHGQHQNRMEAPSLAAEGHQAWVGSVL